MATEVTLHLRNGTAVQVNFDDDEWEFKDTERVVLLLDRERRVCGGANLGDFVRLTVVRDGDGE